VVVHRLGLEHGDEPVAVSDADGVAGISVGGSTQVLRQARLDRPGARVTVQHAGSGSELTSAAEEPGLALRVDRLVLGERRLQAALVRPVAWEPDDGPLPVLLDPYGGPGAQRVLAAAGAFGTSQWFAEQGFAVLVVDGRGTPGRGPAWEREVAGDLSTAPLTDQLDALAAAAEEVEGLDTSRVAIRGWSFGGYLAALAVLRRSDLVHAAIAGAPVTDWALYDTHYTERYLGTPQEQPDAYRRSSLLDEAEGLERPLLIIHGLADDNVVVAHSLRLSRALLEAGRPHQVLPLSQVTHMTPQEDVAEHLLRLQLDFLREALRLS
jgi:dipeptidyl-peptidase-4